MDFFLVDAVTYKYPKVSVNLPGSGVESCMPAYHYVWQ